MTDKRSSAGAPGERRGRDGRSRAMAASLSWLYLVAAVLAPITLLLPHHPGTQETGVVAVGLAALAIGTALRLGRRRTPALVSEALLAVGTVMTGVAIHVTAGVPNAASLLFLWIALYAGYFLPRARAGAQLALVAGCYAAVIAVRPPPFPPVAHWATTVVAVVVAAAIVWALKTRVERLVRRLGERADALVRSERETRLIVDTAQHAFVAFDADGRIEEWSRAAEETFGWTRDEALGRPIGELVVAERHREGYERVLRAFAAGAAVPGGSREAIALDRRRREIPVEVSLAVLPREDGAIISAFISDISERRRLEEERRRERDRLERMGDLARALARAQDAGEIAALACNAAVDVAGVARARLVADAADSGDRVVLAAAGSRATAPGGPPDHVQSVSAGRAGTTVLELDWPGTDGAPDGTDALVALLAADVAGALERVALLARLEDAARRDELTGLANRRVWGEQLPREVARARRSGRPFAVALLDLDRFKLYNDAHGHPAGDRLLARSALRWVAELRPTDLLARYGGEEFGLLLPDCGVDEARAIVERLRRATPSGQTCSAGLAAWDGEETAEALVARADAALYVAKAAGRDATHVAAPA